MTRRMTWTVRKRIRHHDALRYSETRTPLRGRSTILWIILGDGAIFSTRRAGPEDRRASNKMTVDVGVGRRRRECRQRMALAGRRRRSRMRVRVRMGHAVVGTDTGERGRWRRHRRRYRRLGARGHDGDVGRRHWTRQCSGTRQSAGTGSQVSAHYVTRRAHGRGIVGPASRIDRGRRRTRIAVVAHVAPAAVVHLHAVEAHVVGWRRARVADVTRLRHCNIRCDKTLDGSYIETLDIAEETMTRNQQILCHFVTIYLQYFFTFLYFIFRHSKKFRNLCKRLLYN